MRLRRLSPAVSTVHSNKPELRWSTVKRDPLHAALRKSSCYDHSDDPYSSDVHDMRRTAPAQAAFAGGRYEAVIVFDGAGNISSERPNLRPRRVEFSPTGVSADTVVQLCIEAREGRPRVLRMCQ